MYLFVSAALFALLSAGIAQAGVIVSTDFDGRTVSGATASNITYTLDSVQDPGNWTAVPNDAGSVSLFNTTDAQNRFAVVDNPPNWTVTLPIVVLLQNIDVIELDDIVLTVESFNSSGVSKVGTGSGQPNFVTVRLYNQDFSTLLVQQQLGQTSGVARELWTGTYTAFDGIQLAAGATYQIQLDTDGSASGNYLGFREFTVNGAVVVPEPASLAIAAAGLISLAAAGRRWRRL